jgi:amino acid transporter
MAPPDVELTTIRTKDSLAQGSSDIMREPLYSDRPHLYSDHPRPSVARRVFDSFRRDPKSHLTHEGPKEDGLEAGRLRSSTPYYDFGLARKLKGRHLQMIAIGGSIGTGLFVASGQALNAGGPASVLIAFASIGVMLYCTCQALGELAVAFPVAGSFASYSTRFLDPSWGFAMGWK